MLSFMRNGRRKAKGEKLCRERGKRTAKTGKTREQKKSPVRGLAKGLLKGYELFIIKQEK